MFGCSERRNRRFRINGFHRQDTASALSQKSMFPCLRTNLNAHVRLFCFPYAGGNASVFRTWADSLSQVVELFAVELPGRGARLRETTQDNLEPLVQELAHSLTPYFDRPFAFFGHSMGALIGFELARFLRRYQKAAPIHLFISGHIAPQLPRNHKCIHALPESAFIEELRNLNGTPESVLENKELMQLLLPILRADFRICETYQYLPESPLDCPMTVLGGLQDVDVSQESLAAWQEQTSAAFEIRMFSGDHFFFQTRQAAFLKVFSDEIEQMVARIGEKRP